MKRLHRKKDPSLQQINDLILYNLPFLVKISSERTHELISLYNRTAERTVIKYLSAYPELQRQYLEKVMKRRVEGKNVEDELLLIHIDLLCRDKEEKEVYI